MQHMMDGKYHHRVEPSSDEREKEVKWKFGIDGG